MAALTDISQSILLVIEYDKINLGVERKKALARTLKCHPAVLVFPGWRINEEQAA